jgi:hypothetical protein
MTADLSPADARRIALAAQGFAHPRPANGAAGAGDLRGVIDRIGLLQIDSVNILVRSHYLPLFSRLGPYPMDLLDELAYERRELFEYWAHAACLIPAQALPLLRHRMEDRSERPHLRRYLDEHRDYVDAVLEQLRRDGPITAGELDDPGERTGPWWGYGKGKVALEALFMCGRVAVAGRRNFARLYDLPERVFPAEHFAGPAPSIEEAHRALLLNAASALGIGTAADLLDYYRLPKRAAQARLAELVDSGAVQQVTVAGWKEPAYLDPAAEVPQAVEARALLSPFDSLIWATGEMGAKGEQAGMPGSRGRTQRLFGFRYSLEIYVPAAKRVFGYYVLPFLLGDRLVGRVDLKADRKAKTLLVRGAYAEPDEPPGRVAEALAYELGLMAQWLGLPDVRVEPHGNLASALAAATGG